MGLGRGGDLRAQGSSGRHRPSRIGRRRDEARRSRRGSHRRAAKGDLAPRPGEAQAAAARAAGGPGRECDAGARSFDHLAHLARVRRAGAGGTAVTFTLVAVASVDQIWVSRSLGVVPIAKESRIRQTTTTCRRLVANLAAFVGGRADATTTSLASRWAPRRAVRRAVEVTHVHTQARLCNLAAGSIRGKAR